AMAVGDPQETERGTAFRGDDAAWISVDGANLLFVAVSDSALLDTVVADALAAAEADETPDTTTVDPAEGRPPGRRRHPAIGWGSVGRRRPRVPGGGCGARLRDPAALARPDGSRAAAPARAGHLRARILAPGPARRRRPRRLRPGDRRGALGASARRHRAGV